MIPNLSELTPPQEEKRSLKKLVRPALALLVLLAFGGGVVWFYTIGIHKIAREETSILGGLNAVAGDLWTTGTAAEIRVMDPELLSELARLRLRQDLNPEVVVLPAQNGAGQVTASHELIYLQGQRQILLVRVYLDQQEGKVDVVSFVTGPEFMAP